MKTDDERMDDARAELADMFCGNCKEYKGMTDAPNGERYCVFCEDEPEDFEDTDDVADYIRWEQEAQLGAIEDHYGIEPRGWEDSY